MDSRTVFDSGKDPWRYVCVSCGSTSLTPGSTNAHGALTDIDSIRCKSCGHNEPRVYDKKKGHIVPCK